VDHEDALAVRRDHIAERGDDGRIGHGDGNKGEKPRSLPPPYAKAAFRPLRGRGDPANIHECPTRRFPA
jgi:hypothetical protein